MNIRKSLESKTLIGGIEVGDLALSFLLWVGLCLVVIILKSIFQISSIFYAFSFLVFIALIVVLRRASKQKHPTFLRSWVSFHLLQAKEIEMVNPQFLQNKMS